MNRIDVTLEVNDVNIEGVSARKVSVTLSDVDVSDFVSKVGVNNIIEEIDVSEIAKVLDANDMLQAIGEDFVAEWAMKNCGLIEDRNL
jgi:hypothetical protein